MTPLRISRMESVGCTVKATKHTGKDNRDLDTSVRAKVPNNRLWALEAPLTSTDPERDRNE